MPNGTPKQVTSSRREMVRARERGERRREPSTIVILFQTPERLDSRPMAVLVKRESSASALIMKDQ